MLRWCPTRELCEERGQEKGWAININKTLRQLSPRSSSSTSLTQELETRLSFFFCGVAFGSGFEGTQKDLKKETEIYYPLGQK